MSASDAACGEAAENISDSSSTENRETAAAQTETAKAFFMLTFCSVKCSEMIMLLSFLTDRDISTAVNICPIAIKNCAARDLPSSPNGRNSAAIVGTKVVRKTTIIKIKNGFRMAFTYFIVCTPLITVYALYKQYKLLCSICQEFFRK